MPDDSPDVIRRYPLTGKYVYTSELTGTEAVDDTEYRAFVHVAGNFPVASPT